MFERFTDRARRVVVLAQEEARHLNHDYIGTEHILLGLIHEQEGIAARALTALDISLEAVRAEVKETIGQGAERPGSHIPFTPRAKKVLELSLRAFQALDCEGFARVDFFYEEATGRVLLNEVNTIPGFTPKSMFPMLWAASGLAYPDLVARLVDLAVERHAARKR